MKPELLSPAGDLESGYAAIYYGADAVYLGLGQFSARATATNFTPEELSHFTAFTHSKGKKVFVTINTIIKDSEIESLHQSLDLCEFCKVDAIIIQDLGVAKIIKESYPSLTMHASTQMAIHNWEGALTLKEMGFKRVVLARELTLTQIKEIASIKGLETEVFIHGALCYSYSGLCLFSSLAFGKSANRGACLYPCRSCFKSANDTNGKHLFSMKDLALSTDILKLPVTSLKIEGRKKTALYVAAVTDYYRHILDEGEAYQAKEENIKQIFSRPWSKFNFNGKDKSVTDHNFIGHRGLFIGKVESILKDKITLTTNHKIGRHDGIQIEIEGNEKPFGFSAKEIFIGHKSVYEAPGNSHVTLTLPADKPFIKQGAPVFLASSGEVKGTYPYTKPKPSEYQTKTNITVDITITPTQISATSGNYQSTINDNFSPASDPKKTTDAITEAFNKTGNTTLSTGKLNINNPDKLFVPKSILNELRRDLFSKIEITRKTNTLPSIDTPIKHSFKGFIIKTDNPSCLSKIDIGEISEIIWQIEPDSQPDFIAGFPKNKIRIALPCICKNPKGYQPIINLLLRQGYKKWEIGNYWGLQVLPKFGIDLSFSEQIYTLNHYAIQMAKGLKSSRITLPIEGSLATLTELAKTSQLPTVHILYQDTPLFISEVCIKENPCKSCDKKDVWQTLTDKHNTYEALSHNCQTFVFAKEANYTAPKAKQIPADFYRIDFMYKNYTSNQAETIFSKIVDFAEIKGTRPANLLKEI